MVGVVVGDDCQIQIVAVATQGPQGPPVTPNLATTAQLESIVASVNTSGDKIAGYEVWNTTTNSPVWAVGSADGDTWVNGVGTLTHTPVL